MQSRVINFITAEKERIVGFNKVRHFLYDLNCDYPFFEEWLEKVFVLTYTNERSIIICESDDGLEIYGLCIIKKSPEENKICTIRVASDRMRQGIGSFLISKAIVLLEDKAPLVTVPQKHIAEFTQLFKQFQFKLVERVKSIYNEGCYEYYFNKPFIRENVMLSIRPLYVDKMMSGVKGVEFRKKCFGSMVKRVYVYASSPIKKIVGYFTIKKVESASPKVLWERFGNMGGIEEKDYYKYFVGSDNGYAILLKDFIPFNYSLCIDDVFGEQYTVPQNYRFIDNVRVLHRMNLLVNFDKAILY